MNIDKKFNFRSFFNLVTERYKIKVSLLSLLRENGFEIAWNG